MARRSNQVASRIGRCGALALAAMTAASCSMDADISRWSGPDQVGRIVESDESALYIQRDAREPNVRVPRPEIRDVDHPGNVLMVVGGLMLGFWGFRMADSPFRSELANGGPPAGQQSVNAIPITFLFAVPGALMFSAGTLMYTRSKRAAANFEEPPPARSH